MGGGIPDRWLDYSKIGKPMRSDQLKTAFISFKVPLKQQITRALEEKELFSPDDLISMCKDANINLGLIIDLTFTKRYYPPQVFTSAGIKHVKIPIEGQMIPKKARMEVFAETVEEYIKENEGEDKVIGVHCTHGVNRTGYTICKYLVDKASMTADDAIELFNSCRGHPIEREQYLHHLKTGELPETEKSSYHDGSYDTDKWNRHHGKSDYRDSNQERYTNNYNNYGYHTGYTDRTNDYNPSYRRNEYSWDRRQSNYRRGDYDAPYHRYQPYGREHNYGGDRYYYDDYSRSDRYLSYEEGANTSYYRHEQYGRSSESHSRYGRYDRELPRDYGSGKKRQRSAGDDRENYDGNQEGSSSPKRKFTSRDT